jgi:hypothetical protein
MPENSAVFSSEGGGYSLSLASSRPLFFPHKAADPGALLPGSAFTFFVDALSANIVFIML